MRKKSMNWSKPSMSSWWISGPLHLPHFQQGGAAYHHKFHPKARLNIGDLFTYSLAKELDLPLFFQGTDFMHTDLRNAMSVLGYEMSAVGVPQPLTAPR